MNFFFNDFMLWRSIDGRAHGNAVVMNIRLIFFAPIR